MFIHDKLLLQLGIRSLLVNRTGKRKKVSPYLLIFSEILEILIQLESRILIQIASDRSRFPNDRLRKVCGNKYGISGERCAFLSKASHMPPIFEIFAELEHRNIVRSFLDLVSQS